MNTSLRKILLGPLWRHGDTSLERCIQAQI